MARFEHEHRIARVQGVGQRRLPGTGSGRTIDHNRVLRLENLLDAAKHRTPQRPELGATMVDRWVAHRTQQAIGNGTWHPGFAGSDGQRDESRVSTLGISPFVF
jgi:hypothetical protein